MNTPTRLELLGHWIAGAAVADTDRLAPVTNPATGEITRQVAMASKATVEAAIGAAQAAFPAWRATAPQRRARVLFAFKALLEKNADRIVEAITGEHGKVLDDALGELQRGIEVVDALAETPTTMGRDGGMSQPVTPPVIKKVTIRP